MTFKEWMRRNLCHNNIKNIAKYGVSEGFPHLITYTDTTKLYDRFSNEIWEALAEDCAMLSGKNILKFISTLPWNENVWNETTFKNLLVWYMAERTAHIMLQEAENE